MNDIDRDTNMNIRFLNKVVFYIVIRQYMMHYFFEKKFKNNFLMTSIFTFLYDRNITNNYREYIDKKFRTNIYKFLFCVTRLR